jgi:hypothetical protein
VEGEQNYGCCQSVSIPTYIYVHDFLVHVMMLTWRMALTQFHVHVQSHQCPSHDSTPCAGDGAVCC